MQASGCGGDVDYTFDDGSGGAVPWAVGGTASGGNPFQQSSGGRIDDASGGSTPYDETECPPVDPPETLHDCDPLDPAASCEYYESCLPYIAYPDRQDGCGSPGYGEVCWYAGSGRQGELCTADGTGCEPGFMCVIGAAGGERCAQICRTSEDDTCPGGLICGETDVLGYGVCY